jgi:hypothetical protein
VKEALFEDSETIRFEAHLRARRAAAIIDSADTADLPAARNEDECGGDSGSGGGICCSTTSGAGDGIANATIGGRTVSKATAAAAVAKATSPSSSVWAAALAAAPACRQGGVMDRVGQALSDHRTAALRRDAVAKAFEGKIIVIEAGPEIVRSNDTYYRYRPHSAFAHLTGWGAETVPESVLVIDARGKKQKSVLYFRETAGKNTDEFFANSQIGEFWVGSRPNLKQVAALLGIQTKSLKKLETDLAEHKKKIREGKIPEATN